jgi:hypothetical protein
VAGARSRAKHQTFIKFEKTTADNRAPVFSFSPTFRTTAEKQRVSKLLLLMSIGVWSELFSNLLWFVWHTRKFFCNGWKGLEQLTMIVDLKVESSLCQNLAVFGGNYSFLGPTTDGLI